MCGVMRAHSTSVCHLQSGSCHLEYNISILLPWIRKKNGFNINFLSIVKFIFLNFFSIPGWPWNLFIYLICWPSSAVVFLLDQIETFLCSAVMMVLLTGKCSRFEWKVLKQFKWDIASILSTTYMLCKRLWDYILQEMFHRPTATKFRIRKFWTFLYQGQFFSCVGHVKILQKVP